MACRIISKSNPQGELKGAKMSHKKIEDRAVSFAAKMEEHQQFVRLCFWLGALFITAFFRFLQGA